MYTLVIKDHHRQVGHSGASYTWSSPRQQFWILRESTIVRKTIGKCLQCRKRDAKPSEQIMVDLPKERFAVDKPPFTVPALITSDLFWLNKEEVL